MTDTTTTAVRGFQFRTQGGDEGILNFVDAVRALVTRTQAKDTDTMVLRAGGMQAMLMSMMGMAAFMIVTKNAELANILSDTAGFEEDEEAHVIGDEHPAAFADDGSLAANGFVEGVESANYNEVKAQVEAERAEAAAQSDATPEPVEPVVEEEAEEEDDFDIDFDDDDDDWDDYEDDDFEDDDDYEDD